MKMTLAVLCCVLGLGLAPSAPNNLQVMSSRPNYVFNDEFSGERLDGSKWVSGDWVQDVSALTPDNVSVVNGRLFLKAAPKGDGSYTASAVLSTFCQPYGRWEARIRFPIGAKGIWPAFWMVPETYPASLENQQTVLIAEWFGAWPSYMTVAFAENDGAAHYPQPPFPSDAYPRGQFAETWHIYSTELRPTFCSIKIDGLEVYQWKGNIPSVPMRIILQSLVAGVEPAGPPVDDSIFPQYTEVDWIRVYP